MQTSYTHLQMSKLYLTFPALHIHAEKQMLMLIFAATTVPLMPAASLLLCCLLDAKIHSAFEVFLMQMWLIIFLANSSRFRNSQ